VSKENQHQSGDSRAEVVAVETAAPRASLRLFILSGQSNMGKLDPDATFLPALRQAFPEDELVVVKSALGGQPIRRWYKAWKPVAPMSESWNERENGDLYDVLMTKVRNSLGSRRPDSICFVWMQGERDAKTGHGAVYERSLAGLLGQLRADLGREDVYVVIGRISGHGLGAYADWELVRAAQVRVAQSDPLAAWVDTDDLDGPEHELHYTEQGYRELGRRFAQKAIALIRGLGHDLQKKG
jgi:hypothetical protein